MKRLTQRFPLPRTAAGLAVVMLLIFFCGQCAAESTDKSEFGLLKKDYLHLRNTDSHITLEDDWRSVAAKLEQYGINHRRTDAPAAFFDAAIMFRTLFEEKQKEDDLRKAQQLFSTIVSDYSDAAVAPESLKELSELSRKYDNDEERARSYLKKIVTKYPKSDFYDYAYNALYGESDQKKSESFSSESKEGGPTVVLDPGHGGEDFGAVGVSGLLEKDVVLDIALLLEQDLKNNLGAKVILTRRTDTFVPLQRRMELANEANADIFVSLHANSSEAANLSGFEIYVLDNTDDKASQTLSERENASGGGADDISFMLSDLIQSSKSPESYTLAKSIQSAVSKDIPRKWSDARVLSVKKAPFYVLVGAHMPAVLAELFFINEAHDGAHLIESSFRKDLAQALYDGIAHYLKK